MRSGGTPAVKGFRVQVSGSGFADTSHLKLGRFPPWFPFFIFSGGMSGIPAIPVREISEDCLKGGVMVCHPVEKLTDTGAKVDLAEIKPAQPLGEGLDFFPGRGLGVDD